MVYTINDTADRTGQGSTGVRHAVAHRITEADFYGQLIFIHQLFQLCCKGNHAAIEIGSCDILKMTARGNAHIQSSLYNFQIAVDCLLSGFVQLIENVIVGAGNQNPTFGHPHFLDQLEVLLCGTNPSCDFGEFIA